ncbi:MAG: cation:proton antiporter [Candidatus Micrarchaeota archaeon]
MADIFSFFIVMAAGLFFAEFFRPFHMPYVVVLILTGILIGPSALNFFTPDDTIEFIGQIGLVFLMFMAGLEARLSVMAELRKSVAVLAILNGFIPFIAGVAIALSFGYGWTSALFLGTIFISSSIAVIIPSLQANNLLQTRLGKTILGATIAEDVASLVIFSILLQTINPTHNVPLPLFYLVLFMFLVTLRVFIQRLRKFYQSLLSRRARKEIFENEVRFIFAILLATVVLFEILGLHAIIAGFFAGMALSESIKKDILKKKLHAISYGLFIPVFFVIIGSQTDIQVLLDGSGVAVLAGIIVMGSVASKFLSGFLSGKLSGFTSKESSIMGSATLPQLSTTLAVAFIGLELNLFGPELILAMTILSILTTIAGPYIIGILVERKKPKSK